MSQFFFFITFGFVCWLGVSNLSGQRQRERERVVRKGGNIGTLSQQVNPGHSGRLYLPCYYIRKASQHYLMVLALPTFHGK